MPLINITGFADNDPVPGNYIEVNFAQGPASAGTSSYPILILANKLSTGAGQVDGYIYGPDTTVSLNSEADMIALAGSGSEAHRLYKQVLKVNQSSSVYALFVTESAGSAASGTIAVTGTANANATLRVYVQDEFVDVSVVTADSAASVATAVAAAINSKTEWAVTASPSSGNVTVTAKQKGPRGNFIRISARCLTSCGLTVTPGSQTALSGGTTADSNAAALTTIAGQRFYYIVSAANDATQFGALCTQVDSQAGPITGIRQRAFAGSVDTLANTITLTTAINKARAEVIWQEGSDLTPGELAANCAAVYALNEASFGAQSLNYSGYGNDAVSSASWTIKAPISGAVPTRNQLKSALNSGITPIAVSRGSNTYLVKRVTTRFLNGSNSDYRIRDAHKVTVCDRFADDLLAKYAAQLSRKLIGDDPAPGSFPPPNTVTPRVMQALIAQQVREYAAGGLLKNADKIVATTQVVRENSPTTRMSARIPLDVADILDQVATAIDQVG